MNEQKGIHNTKRMNERKDHLPFHPPFSPSFPFFYHLPSLSFLLSVGHEIMAERRSLKDQKERKKKRKREKKTESGAHALQCPVKGSLPMCPVHSSKERRKRRPGDRMN